MSQGLGQVLKLKCFFVLSLKKIKKRDLNSLPSWNLQVSFLSQNNCSYASIGVLFFFYILMLIC